MSNADSSQEASQTTEYRTEIDAAANGVLEDGLRQIFDHWNDIRGNAFAPPWPAFDWIQVPANLIPHCAVADVQRDPLDFIYRFWGTGRTVMQGADYTGRSLSTFEPRAIAEKAFAEYRAVLERKTALRIMTFGLKNFRSERSDYEFLRLPFSDDGEDIHQVLAVGAYNPKVMKSTLDFYGIRPVPGRVVG
jgi:hypothetical protein